jgi:hypothetical protein
MNDPGIFVYGAVVFAMVVVGAYCSMIVSDNPND